jgi:hypothetical protein
MPENPPVLATRSKEGSNRKSKPKQEPKEKQGTKLTATGNVDTKDKLLAYMACYY